MASSTATPLRSFAPSGAAASLLPPSPAALSALKARRRSRRSSLAVPQAPSLRSCAARSSTANRPEDDPPNQKVPRDEQEVDDLGVRAALSMLKFYKREISPLMLSSCRYVPTCSEYSMQAYKKYGVAKGTILTAWRLCRCNPLGGSGFDPPRWFGEEKPYDQD